MAAEVEEPDITEPHPDDRWLVRMLREQLRERQRELKELRPLRDAAQEAAEAAGVDGEQDAGQSKDGAPKGLVRSLQQATARVRELEGEKRMSDLRATFDAAGVPPGELRDLLGAKVEDPSDVTVEGLQGWMQSNGIRAWDPVAEHRTAATRNIDELRAGAQPVGSQRMGWDDHTALQKLDPAAAAHALQAGQVELPGHVARVIAANRAEREQNGFFGQ